MFFDDRLATVLRHRAAGENAARTQFRQLLDLLGNRKYGRDESLIAAAWLRLGALGEQIPANVRARIVAEPGWRFRSPELAAHLAEDEPEVASAALSRAQLTEEDWEALIPRLPIRARGFLRLRRDLPEGAVLILERLGIRDRGLPQPEHAEDVAATDGPSVSDEVQMDDAASADLPKDGTSWEEPELRESVSSTESREETMAGTPREGGLSSPPTRPIDMPPPSRRKSATGEEKSEITALVERIAQFRRDREAGVPPVDNSPQLPLGEMPERNKRGITGFGFTTDAAGRIEWADPAVAPMVIGKRLVPARRLGDDSPIDAMARAFTRQQPIENAPRSLEGAPQIAGQWVIDAHPRFARSGGRFHGYVGRFRRPAPEGMLDPRAASEADRIRQLLHELRTPVNALQGFAEVIQQQLFGPAPHEYRAMAAAIAGDAARILAGFDELERLARLESGVAKPTEGTSDFAAIVGPMTEQIQQVLSPRMAGLEFDRRPTGPMILKLEESEAETLAWRVLATLAGTCAAGETIALSLSQEEGYAVLSCELPADLIAQDDLFAAQARPVQAGLSAGLFGAGFSLRLARAEVRAAGGVLDARDNQLTVRLPLLTEVAAANSQNTTTERSEAGIQQG